ncbi:MAG: reactive intermediate/imine deaminase [Flavobacteriales bacterium CG_4_9_14_0_2_um_filter_35_242]|nr:RidA family protein [Zetaproteobacteria bacterium]OIO10465.1 MAG: reactive intermediate/imine deaminase [Flavobacteriaceae bacterium CG1_02_35_72]PIV16754.1 MAG: reactive intermediate/imine deaminase [Flavobacteriales bacterium CG03_land_8_20_14_0_80_35_15]PIX06958.1 MAG: reactive intermediate/imine deaminase [Flavobacteriales bacterium CG_4_8_14_3_um_filter_35_10]PJA05967.1 MAG: reactive intermediate/imine deaminase [Flavobacteriales bacterium CG_4_10_14_0_2_um_filter_35_18]PJC60619.1 MAG:
MKKIIATKNAPAPIGPYNQAVLCNNTLFISGQIAFNVATQTLETGNIKNETELVMQNLKAILSEAGFTFEHVVKTTIFIKNMDDFAVINEVYGAYFNAETAPTRETVEVARLPKDVNVEISMIAMA